MFCVRQTQTILNGNELNCSLYVELNCSVYVELNCSYVRRTQLFFIHRTQSVLVCRTWRFSCYVKLKVFYSTLQLVYSTPSAGPSVLQAYFVKSPISGPSINAYSVNSSVILYSALCSRTSLYPVSRVYTTLSTLDSATLKYRWGLHWFRVFFYLTFLCNSE